MRAFAAAVVFALAAPLAAAQYARDALELTRQAVKTQRRILVSVVRADVARQVPLAP
jgi:hypothetical protein